MIFLESELRLRLKTPKELREMRNYWRQSAANLADTLERPTHAHRQAISLCQQQAERLEAILAERTGMPLVVQRARLADAQTVRVLRGKPPAA